MIDPAQLAALPPARRAQLIYAQAQSEMNARLWRAALGDSDRDRDAGRAGVGQPTANGGMGMDALLQLIAGSGTAGTVQHCCHCTHAEPGAVAPSAPRDPTVAAAAVADAAPADSMGAGLALGPNDRHAGTLAAAEARTGIPASALAAIVDAESGKNRDGSWNPLSRNPRSSAAGLGQFLSGTWLDLARSPGTWLNAFARQRGWIDGAGRIAEGARADLLALRYQPEAAINAVADFARSNLERLEAAGIRVRLDSETLAKAAYLSHHLGLGDARRFLGGGIDAGRARTLLAAQIGSSAAAERIESAGSATKAHRQWLLGYIDRHIRPERFSA